MAWWRYLLLANVYLTAFYLFYTLLLRRETFFRLNRVYLIGAVIFSFLIPVMQTGWFSRLFITRQLQQTIYQAGPHVIQQLHVSAATIPQQFTLGQILTGIYLAGVVLLGLRFIYQLALLNYFINQPGSDTTYSFFGQIKIENRDDHRHVINLHEEVHARQWHSADVLLMEAVTILNWFNPVVYVYRNAVKHVHEFIADHDALKTGTNKADYALLLLSRTFATPPHHLVNSFFNTSLLKRRILMLHKNRSKRLMLVKYGFAAPLFALMLIISAATVDKGKTGKFIGNAGEQLLNQAAEEISFNAALSPADKRDLDIVLSLHQRSAGERFADRGSKNSNTPSTPLTHLSKTVAAPALTPRDSALLIPAGVSASRLADTAALEARFAGRIQPEPQNVVLRDVNVTATSLKPGYPAVPQKGLAILKEKAAQSMFGEKATTGIVQIITKHHPFLTSQTFTR